MATFRCRKCRILLFSVRELESHKVSTDQVNQVSSDLASFDKCSSWFLKDEDILPWIAESVEEVGLRKEYNVLRLNESGTVLSAQTTAYI